jgi:hypothetical protein
MAEERQKKKKRGIVRRIFKWLGLILLTILFVLSITFQAPWKIITLLAIILSACTILPKRLRKRFWLSVATIVFVLITWVFLSDEDGDWRPYTFDEELTALQAKYAIPDEENAALVYDELFKTMNGDPNEPKFFIKSTPSSRDEPWLSKDHPETADWLKSQQNTIEKLLQAAKKDKCLFPIIATDSVTYSEYMKNLPKMRHCTFLLLSAANNDMAEGRIDAALEKYLCIIQTVDHMYQQPAMMYHLVGFAIEYMALIPLNRFVIEGRPDGDQLELIGNSIKGPENNWGADWRKMLDFEKLYAKNSLCSMFYEINQQGKIRLSGGQLIINRQFPQTMTPRTYSQKKLAKTKRIFGWLYFPSSPKKVSEFIDADFEKYYAMADTNYVWSEQPGLSQPRHKVNYRYMVELLTTLSGSSYYRIHEIFLRDLAFHRGSRLLVSLKQYQIENGHWPENLDAIKSLAPAEAFIDPVNGKEFRYENHGQRFSLYGEAINIWPK